MIPRPAFSSLVPALTATFLVASAAWAEDPVPVRLFHIERNTNANIVAYDAMVESGGDLRKKDPIDVYWVRLAEDGRRKGLSGIEKRMAYGYKEKERAGNELIIEMRADIGRLISVAPVADGFRARIDIAGRPAYLDKVFIQATEGGILPTVDHIELHGTDVETGQAVFEKFEP